MSDTRERPILFSGDMVRAILDGRKTQTRRVVKPQPEVNHGEVGDVFYAQHSEYLATNVAVPGGYKTIPLRCPYGKPGDRLWVRETWYDDNALRSTEDRPTGPDKYIEYRADHDCRNWEAGCPCHDESGRSCWRPSIHMPRWASRIDIEMTDVRVERLDCITENAILAEGIVVPSEGNPFSLWVNLWDAINAKRGYSWASNPWVWVVSFKVVRP